MDQVIERNAQQMTDILPKKASKDATRIIAEPSSVNIFAEIRKPEHG